MRLCLHMIFAVVLSGMVYMKLFKSEQSHTGKCKSTGAGCNALVQSKLRTGVRLKWRKR